MTRADGPPGRKRNGPRAVTPTQGDRLHTLTSPPLSAEVAPSVPRGSDGTMARLAALLGLLAALLGLSDERDQWQRVGLARERAAWRRGWRDGYGAGYRAGYELAVRAWKVTAGVVSGGPSHAELDRRRYPPGGRESWIVPRPGEDTGSQRD
jgi:hypothetical protein